MSIMASKPRERAPKQAPSSPMNWRPRTAEDLIGQAKRVAMAQASKAKRLSSDPSATMKLLLYGPPGVGKTSVVKLVALQLAGTPLAIEDYNGREVTVDLVREWMRQLAYSSLFSSWSVKIVNELDRCSREAQDLLLTYSSMWRYGVITLCHERCCCFSFCCCHSHFMAASEHSLAS
jgi:replication-associated recombination protein RarA